MEQIVRPFQLIDPLSKVRVPVVSSSAAPVQPAHLCWGSAGTLPTAIQQAQNFNGVNFRLDECDTHLKESARQTEDVRVENPDDSDQFVIVQRIRSIDMGTTSKKDYVNTFNTDTLNIALPDLFSGTGFGDISKQTKCNEKFYYNR